MKQDYKQVNETHMRKHAMRMRVGTFRRHYNFCRRKFAEVLVYMFVRCVAVGYR